MNIDKLGRMSAANLSAVANRIGMWQYSRVRGGPPILKARIVTALMSLLLLSGCATQFVYNNIDWLGVDYIEDYVSLSAEQESQLQRQLQNMQQWHRRSELPQYYAHLSELRAVQPEAINDLYLIQQQRKFEQHWWRLVQYAAPTVSDLTISLTDEQKLELLKNIAVAHKEKDDEYIDKSEDEIRQSYYEKLQERTEEWVGTLTSTQKSQLKAWANEMLVTNEFWSAYRQAYLRYLAAMLAEPDPSLKQAQIDQLLYNADALYSTELRQALDYNRQLFINNLTLFATSMTQKQWAYYRKQVTEWMELAQELQSP
ncbi:hypothetical protein HGP28_17025 [Vibrio sp. SM6]|uniref:Lipoprotein n=1 Tax=Vibrio agarilyticus TaxID=2726741 RepID=A0A7X8TTY7_9VIBR|nr:DUF6279 family lipoprotein [Vibrio agarilyticus]NLS14566.1 hypothetical protein [Vibrio agarilyticus]